MKATQLFSLLQFAIKNREAILIKGMPGIGKTDIAHAACNGLADLIVSHPVVSDPTDYKGLPFADAKGKSAHFLPFGELQSLIDASKPTVFFLDDLGQAAPSVQAAAMQLILSRHINGHKVSEHVTFMAATNRKADMAGVSGILEPVKSRFATIVELEPDVEEWVAWALKNNMPSELIAFIRFRPAHLTAWKPTKDIVNTPSPRTIAAIGRMQRAGLSMDLEREVFMGACGEAFATEYVAFLEQVKSMPDIDKVILDPDRAEVPREPSVRYAMIGALVQRMDKSNIANIIKYLDRMPKELAVVCMKDAKQRDITLLQNAAAITWMTQNHSVVI